MGVLTVLAIGCWFAINVLTWKGHEPVATTPAPQKPVDDDKSLQLLEANARDMEAGRESGRLRQELARLSQRLVVMSQHSAQLLRQVVQQVADGLVHLGSRDDVVVIENQQKIVCKLVEVIAQTASKSVYGRYSC